MAHEKGKVLVHMARLVRIFPRLGVRTLDLHLLKAQPESRILCHSVPEASTINSSMSMFPTLPHLHQGLKEEDTTIHTPQRWRCHNPHTQSSKMKMPIQGCLKDEDANPRYANPEISKVKMPIQDTSKVKMPIQDTSKMKMPIQGCLQDEDKDVSKISLQAPQRSQPLNCHNLSLGPPQG